MADWLHLIYTGTRETHIASPPNCMRWYGFSSDRFLQINTFQYLCTNINNEVYLFVDGESLNTLSVLQFFSEFDYYFQ